MVFDFFLNRLQRYKVYFTPAKFFATFFTRFPCSSLNTPLPNDMRMSCYLIALMLVKHCSDSSRDMLQ